jgi:hypothetical protein
MTTWNPTDKGGTVTLSGSNLTAKQTGTVTLGPLTNAGQEVISTINGRMVRADISSAAGNSDHWQFETTVDAAAAAGGTGACVGIGLANSAQNLSVEFDGTNGIGYHADGWFYGTGGATYTGVTYGNGDLIEVEKLSTGARWYKNGTLVTSQTSIPSGALFPAAIVFNPNDQVTANFGATSFAHTVGGATAWVVDPTTLPARHLVYNKTLPSLFQVATMNTIDRDTGEPVPAPPAGTVGGYFPDTISSVLAGKVVRLDLLVMFDFLSGAMRLWQGFGTLHTNDGNDWQGIGQLGQISDLESAIGGTAPQAKFVLSGVDPQILADALDQQNEIYGRNCNVYMQFFDDNFNCLDKPYVIWAGLMDTIRITQNVDGCQVEMTAETIFARRAKPPLGMLSDREQQMFFPGDNSLAGIPALMSKTAIWPVILPQS